MDKKRRSLSVVIPAFNEERRLPATVAAVHAFLVEKDYDAEIIVVDDGSRDLTSRRIAELQPSLPLLRLRTHATNTGKDFAVFTGVRLATREAVLFSDADLSTPIDDLDRLWDPYDRGAEIVIGSRRRRDSEILIRQPLHRQLSGALFGQLVSLLCIRGFRDTQCGFKLFRSDAIRALIPKMRTRGFAFDVEILMRARAMGLRIAEVGIRWGDAPGSRIRALHHGSRMFLQLLQMNGLI